MVMTTMKHGVHWYVLSRVFKTKGPTFESLFSRFASLFQVHFMISSLKSRKEVRNF